MPYMPRESTAAGTGTWTENGGTAGRDAAVCCVPLVVVLAGPRAEDGGRGGPLPCCVLYLLCRCWCWCWPGRGLKTVAGAGRYPAVCRVPLVVVLAGPGRAVMRLVAADRRRQSVSGRSGQAA